MNRLGLKISCLVVSIIIWIQVASTTTVEQTASLPLRITGLQDGLTVAGSDIPREVRVRLSGSKLRLLSHKYFNRYVGEVRVNLADRAPGPPFSYQLGSGDVHTDLSDPNIQPAVRLRLQVDRQLTRQVPVVLATAGRLRDGLGFLAPPQVLADSVRVTGPGRFFVDGLQVATAPLELGRLQGMEEVSLDLRSPNPNLVLARDEVEVRCAVAPLLERTMANVPVVALVDAGQPEVGISPPLVDVKVRGVADSVRTLTEARFSVTVPVGGLREGEYTLPAQVDGPPWVTLLGVVPAEVRVIVGNPPPAPAPAPTGEGERDALE